MRKIKCIALFLALIIITGILSSCNFSNYLDTKSTEESTAVETTVTEKENEILDLDNLPDFSDEPTVEVNDNIPVFNDYDYADKDYKIFSGLDKLGREGFAQGLFSVDSLPTEKRGSIGDVRPSGWPKSMEEMNYGDLIEGKYLFNRCHLLGYQISGDNNRLNLITGTRYLNVHGMQPFEEQIAKYIEVSKNHVLYRVTPFFEDDNLIASGVQLEAFSVEDEGKGICLNVYAFNVQPGIIIDYKTGDSTLEDGTKPETTAEETTVPETTVPETTVPQTTIPQTTVPQATTTPPVQVTEAPVRSVQPQTYEYVLNTNTKKFHYSWCGSVKRMKPSNTEYFTGTREEVIARGFSPCGNCKP